MIYKNPIIFEDYSDPDVIYHKGNFYLIASSFNHTPGVPVLKSKNLVDWKLINYVFDKIPFSRFNDVCHGDGAWAPALRYHNGLFYAVIPFPDEGIYVASCSDIDKGNWSEPWCLISGKGLIDPCPIWLGNKAYLVIGFAKSRIGFNSVLGLYEVSPDLKQNISKDFTILYDGHQMNPTIEGPKFNTRNGWIYIMAPAGSVKTGWQVCLRSRNIYGPYEPKIVLMQNHTPINGPHQGALIEMENDKWAFVHFQDAKCYGRICHLQPVKWVDDWPLCGEVNDDLLAGSPVLEHAYLVDKKSNYKLDTQDNFDKPKLNLMWQTPANKQEGWYELNQGLKLNCIFHNLESEKALNLVPNAFLTKLAYPSFTIKTKVELHLVNENDEIGFTYMGINYTYICIRKVNGKNHLLIKKGKFKETNDEILYDIAYEENTIEFMMKFKYPGIYQFGYNNTLLKPKYEASVGRWIGGKVGIYAKGMKSGGYGVFEYFKVKPIKG